MSKDETTSPLLVRHFFKPQAYTSCWQLMKQLTQSRNKETLDEVWLLEHEPVYTLGIRERAEDVIETGDIPVVKSDRGGLITYHGPGQLIIYLMLDLHRQSTGLKALVSILEQIIIDLLTEYKIDATRMENAPGVYVEGRKIASLGLRVQRGCTYHGLSLNVDMDLAPFDRIVPCGLTGMKMTDMRSLGVTADINVIGRQFMQVFSTTLGYTPAFGNDVNSFNDDSK
jgi:lipoyl(octanoyl) transferase